MIFQIEVSNIDKVAPVITVKPYTTTPTNQNVTVTVQTNKGTLNATSHTFAENGSFEFVATDGAGNVTTQTVTITNIDKEAPTAPQITLENDKCLVLSGSTDSGSGLDRYEYRLNNGAWTQYTNPVELNDGNYTVYARAIDRAKNETIASATFIVNAHLEETQQTATEAVAKAEETNSQKDAYNQYVLDYQYAENVKQATRYVEQSEKSSTNYNMNKAQEYIDLLPEGDSVRVELQARLDAIKDALALAELNKAIQSAEKAVINAEKYRTATYFNKAQNLVTALPDISEKQALQDRLDVIQLK